MEIQIYLSEWKLKYVHRTNASSWSSQFLFDAEFVFELRCLRGGVLGAALTSAPFQ